MHKYVEIKHIQIYISLVNLKCTPSDRQMYPRLGIFGLRGFGIPRGQQQVQIFLLAPHHGRTKQGRKCSHKLRLWAAFPWV